MNTLPLNEKISPGREGAKAPAPVLRVVGTVAAIAAVLLLAYGALWLARPANLGAESAAGNAAGSAAGNATQVSEGNGVTVSVTWPGKEAGLVFTVGMDTHSGSLDGYDLSKSVVLRSDDGRETAPLSWNAPKGGHHRTGKLIFSDKAIDGQPFIGPNTRTVELTIYDIAGVAQRNFSWKVR